MISILIPTYNKICVPLVQEMYNQASDLQVPFEILVVDDGSTNDIKEANMAINSLEHCHYILLKENIGPAKIRNFLADQAKYDYLLFMDSDTMPSNKTFLKNYLEKRLKNGIVCGGLAYERRENPQMCYLRYIYGIKVEESNANERNKSPYDKFISMCFLASKEVFKSIRFDDKMHFGYEDAWFGVLLKQASIPIIHIDNPVYHQTTDKAEDYLYKIRISIQNLICHKEKMKNHIRLLQWYEKIEKMHLSSIINLCFQITKPLLVRNLTGKHPSIHLFAFYKIGYLCNQLRKHSILF